MEERKRRVKAGMRFMEGGKQEAGYGDRVKHIERNDQSFIKEMM